MNPVAIRIPPVRPAPSVPAEREASINGVSGSGYAIAVRHGPETRYVGKFSCTAREGLDLIRWGRDGTATFDGVLYDAGIGAEGTLTVSITRVDVRGRTVHARFTADAERLEAQTAERIDLDFYW